MENIDSIERAWLDSRTSEQADEAVDQMITHPSLRWKVYLDWLVTENGQTGLRLSEVHRKALLTRESEVYEAIADLLISEA